jgi:hypothetical protein
MNRLTPAVLRSLALAAGLLPCASSLAAAQQTRAERSKYLETSTYQEVVAFIDSLQIRGAKIHVGSIGTSTEGRNIPYVIASRPLVNTPFEAKRLGRPIVYIQGNIHAGEVEGKEALLAILRDLLFDPKKNVLDSIVLIAVPIYNADGNEVFKPQLQNRGAQNGPEMVGQRPNAQQLDLNRDYIKAEAPETRASLAMFNAWDPDLFVDLHTTDGSFHGYALTYSPSLHPAAGIAGATFGGAFVRDSMLPVLRQRMRTRDHFEIFDYGNFSGDEGPRAGPGEMRGWSTYEHKPRYGTNYYGLRGRLSILSEAYSHDPFERRVKSTYAFVQEILTLTAERARAVLALTRGSDAALDAGRIGDVAIRAVLTAKPLMEKVIDAPLVQTAEAKAAAATAPGGGRGGRGGGAGRTACAWPLTEPGVPCGMQRSGKTVTTVMPVKDRFDATLSARLPGAYVLPAGTPDSVIAKLRMHGLQVERFDTRLDVPGEAFRVDSVIPARAAFQGHFEIRVEGAWVHTDHIVISAGYVVRTSQPLGVLAALLLEPQSDDGFATWNLLAAPSTAETTGDPARYFPVYRVPAPVTVPMRIIP